MFLTRKQHDIMLKNESAVLVFLQMRRSFSLEGVRVVGTPEQEEIVKKAISQPQKQL